MLMTSFYQILLDLRSRAGERSRLLCREQASLGALRSANREYIYIYILHDGLQHVLDD